MNIVFFLILLLSYKTNKHTKNIFLILFDLFFLQVMVELPSELLMKTILVLIYQNKSNKNKLILKSIYLILYYRLKANDDNYGSLCEECLTSFLLRYHVITHPCSETFLTKLK